MAIRVSVKDPKLVRASKFVGEKNIRLAAARAINRAMTAGKAEAIRALPKEYAVKQKQVREKVTTSKASSNDLSAAVTFRGYALNLAEFSVRPGKPQPAKRPVLRAMVGRSGGFDKYHGAFLIRARSGDIRAYRRTSEARNMGSRYPITGVWGPSIPQLLGGDTIREAVEDRAREQLDKRLDHEIDRMLDKAFAKAGGR